MSDPTHGPKPDPEVEPAPGRAVTHAAARASSASKVEPDMEFSIRTETCACGERYTAGGSVFFVALAIRTHAATERHQRWRKRAGIE